MHLVVNYGKVKYTHFWCDLLLKGVGTRINRSEKYIWKMDKVDVLWNQNAWVDTNVMKNISHEFVSHKMNYIKGICWLFYFVIT